MLGYPRRDLCTRMHLQLAPDVLDMRFGRPRRHRQAHRDGMEWLLSPSATSPATSSSRPVSRGPAPAGSRR